VRWPIQRVKFALEQRRAGKPGFGPVVVFRFVSEDWSPWVALMVQKRTPTLLFDSRVEYASRADGTEAPLS
jgi:hypothetical protein